MYMSKKISTKSIKNAFKRLSLSVWLFPTILLVILAVLTAGKISGTSVGMYHNFLYGDASKDTSLLFGEPRAIRSDEWLFMSQLTAAQASSGFPKFNENIGSTGRDMSIIIDVPYKEWSVIFKPQNLIFFILPLEYAFAFKWWLLLVLLITSLYFLLLRIFDNKRLLAAIFSIAGTCSPFIFWWYQTATVASVFYGMFIILLAFRIIDGEPLPKIRSKKITIFLYGTALLYLLTCFALIQYPPFQIPVALVIVAVVTGKLLNSFFAHKKKLKPIIKPVVIMALGALGAGLLVGLFLYTRIEAVKDVAGTVYPGSRSISSGGLKKYYLFDGFLMPQLQSSARGASFFNNQSEVSNFILLLPFLLLPGLVVSYKEFRKKKLDWIFIALQALGILFVIRMFTPLGDTFFSLILLNKVPNERLVISLGLVSLLHTFYLVQKIKPTTFKNYGRLLVLVAYSLGCFGVMMLVGLRVKKVYPEFISNSYRIILFAAVVALIVYLLISGKKLFGGILLLVFSVASVIYIHPLYRGLGFITNNHVSETIKNQSDPDDVWAVSGDIVYENLAIIKNRDSLSGVQFYPNVEFWRNLGGPKNDDIYNRYAHVLFESPSTLSEPLRLLQPDLYLVQLNCSDFIRKELDFVVSNKTLTIPCVELLQTVTFPQKTFYLYRLR